MKLLMLRLHPVSGPAGGVQRVLVDLANDMADRGHEVVLAEWTKRPAPFLAPLHDGVRPVNLAERASILDKADPATWGLKVWREAARIIDPAARGRIDERFLLRRTKGPLAALLREAAPDGIIAAGLDAAEAALAAGPARPVVAMLPVSAAKVWQKLTPHAREAARACAAVQCLVPAARDFLAEHIPGGRFVCIPNAVAPLSATPGPRPPVIVSVGRIHRRDKRQHLLIDAFARLAESHPAWRLEIFGGGEQTYVAELHRLVEARRLSGRVSIPGETRDVAAVYGRAAIFAQASPEEGFGLAMAEAMSAGLPAVACRNEGSLALAEGGGAILTEGTAEDIAAGLCRLMDDEALRRRMGEAARASMRRYEPKRVGDAWEALLAEVCRDKA